MDGIYKIVIAIAIIIFIIIKLLFPSEFAAVADRKGYSGGKYFLLTLLFGLPAYLLVIALPDLNASEQRDEVLNVILKMEDK